MDKFSLLSLEDDVEVTEKKILAVEFWWYRDLYAPSHDKRAKRRRKFSFFISSLIIDALYGSTTKNDVHAVKTLHFPFHYIAISGDTMKAL